MEFKIERDKINEGKKAAKANPNTKKRTTTTASTVAAAASPASSSTRLLSSYFTITSNTKSLVGKLIKYIERREKKVLGNKIALAGCYLGNQLQLILEEDQTLEAKEVIRMVALKKWDLDNPVTEVVEDRKAAAASASATLQSQSQTKVELEPLETRQMKQRVNYINKLNEEFERYEQEVLSDDDMNEKPDALGFWKECYWKYPTIAPAALDLICSPMTEVSVERLFSHLSFILHPLRNRCDSTIDSKCSLTQRNAMPTKESHKTES